MVLQDNTSQKFPRVDTDLQAMRAQTAKRAANFAAQEIANEMNRVQQPSTGRFALFTWGALAGFCMLLGAGAVLYPQLIGPLPFAGDVDLIAQEPNGDTRADIVMAPEGPALPTPGNSVSVSGDLLDGRTNKTALRTNLSDELTTSSLPNLATDAALGGDSQNDSPKLGARIGISGDLVQMTNSYRALERRVPDLFHQMSPRVGLHGQQNALIAGPFSSKQEIAVFCRNVKLRLTLECQQTDFTGEPLIAQ